MAKSWWRTLGLWLADRAGEGLWQGWICGLIGGPIVTPIVQLWSTNPAAAVAIGTLVSVVLIVAIAIFREIWRKRVLRTLPLSVLSDKGAAAEALRTVLNSTRKTFDVIAVTGTSLVRMWGDQIRAAVERGATIRILLANVDDSRLQAFAASTGKSLDWLRAEIRDTTAHVEAIKNDLPSSKADKIQIGYLGRCPLYSMWISDSDVANVEVLLYDGRGRGPIVHGSDAGLIAKLDQEFETAWREAVKS
jgi:hypothetical protein